ncbi:MAG: DUF1127 domain-containing protein [Rhodobacteraceae bacterium]|nr:DUF1127 domain-containing protein [Paracoccaceae bacterium]
MALVNYTRPAPFGAITTFNLTNRAEAFLNVLVEWNAKRKTRSALSALSDHELEDIGLIRGDLDRLPARF